MGFRCARLRRFIATRVADCQIYVDRFVLATDADGLPAVVAGGHSTVGEVESQFRVHPPHGRLSGFAAIDASAIVAAFLAGWKSRRSIHDVCLSPVGSQHVRPRSTTSP